MKILKGGKIKLDAGEKRIGNFIIKEETAHMKIQDINNGLTHRISKQFAIGKYLQMCYNGFEGDEAINTTLANYVAFIWSISAIIPDTDFLKTVYEESKSCIDRHPEIYGIPDVPQTDEADAEALRAIKEEKEFEAEVAASGSDEGEVNANQ